MEGIKTQIPLNLRQTYGELRRGYKIAKTRKLRGRGNSFKVVEMPDQEEDVQIAVALAVVKGDGKGDSHKDNEI